VARRFVDEHRYRTHDAVEREHVHLLVTELVTNAVRHSGPPITVSLECPGSGSVLLSVADGSDDLPQAEQVPLTAVGGRGVSLVDLLSAEWGVRHHHPGGTHTDDTATGEGKTVWCLLVGGGVR